MAEELREIRLIEGAEPKTEEENKAMAETISLAEIADVAKIEAEQKGETEVNEQ